MTYRYDTPIRYVRGLGPVKAKELTKIGITTVGELLERHPLSYLYPGGVSIAEASEGNVVIKAKIKTIKRYSSESVVGATVFDETGECTITWYNNPYTLSSLHPGMTVTFWGRYRGGVLQQPKWSTCEASMIDVWGGQYGVHHNTIRAALKEVLYKPERLDLPDINHGCSRRHLFARYHFPEHKEEQQMAERELKQDEALQLQLALAERRRGREGWIKDMLWNRQLDKRITSYFSYDFTTEQTMSISSILGDMCGSNRPMQRLIHGEVGSGKTAVAFYSAMLAALNGKRTLILCPTTILAQQHYDTLKGMGWDDVGIFTGGGTEGRGNPLANIIICTHAMLYNELLIASASLVIIDEFQKFGVEQRTKLQKNNPHLLLLSATPIPRTLAATVFGDLDVSTIKQLPIKRGTVITKWVLPDRREAMYEIIERELAKGHQAYVVYPRISGDEDIPSAAQGFGEMCSRFNGLGHIVDLLTGRETADKKAWSLRDFKEGITQILVSTIIAEVGLDCPNATVMVVEGADRFGLSQLHQLRGRVCRSTDTAFCFLVSETANPTSIARLEAIERTNDGFLIAEEDLRLRGPGETFSTRQSGLPDLKWISLVDDYDLMLEAKELVASGSVGDGVREMMRIRYGDSLGLGGVV